MQRLYELGLLEGDEVEVVRFAPLGDPIELGALGAVLAFASDSTARCRRGSLA